MNPILIAALWVPALVVAALLVGEGLGIVVAVVAALSLGVVAFRKAARAA